MVETTTFELVTLCSVDKYLMCELSDTIHDFHLLQIKLRHI